MLHDLYSRVDELLSVTQHLDTSAAAVGTGCPTPTPTPTSTRTRRRDEPVSRANLDAACTISINLSTLFGDVHKLTKLSTRSDAARWSRFAAGGAATGMDGETSDEDEQQFGGSEVEDSDEEMVDDRGTSQWPEGVDYVRGPVQVDGLIFYLRQLPLADSVAASTNPIQTLFTRDASNVLYAAWNYDTYRIDPDTNGELDLRQLDVNDLVEHVQGLLAELDNQRTLGAEASTVLLETINTWLYLENTEYMTMRVHPSAKSLLALHEGVVQYSLYMRNNLFHKVFSAWNRLQPSEWRRAGSNAVDGSVEVWDPTPLSRATESGKSVQLLVTVIRRARDIHEEKRSGLMLQQFTPAEFAVYDFFTSGGIIPQVAARGAQMTEDVPGTWTEAEEVTDAQVKAQEEASRLAAERDAAWAYDQRHIEETFNKEMDQLKDAANGRRAHLRAAHCEQPHICLNPEKISPTNPVPPVELSGVKKDTKPEHRKGIELSKWGAKKVILESFRPGVEWLDPPPGQLGLVWQTDKNRWKVPSNLWTDPRYVDEESVRSWKAYRSDKDEYEAAVKVKSPKENASAAEQAAYSRAQETLQSRGWVPGGDEPGGPTEAQVKVMPKLRNMSEVANQLRQCIGVLQRVLAPKPISGTELQVCEVMHFLSFVGDVDEQCDVALGLTVNHCLDSGKKQKDTNKTDYRLDTPKYDRLSLSRMVQLNGNDPEWLLRHSYFNSSASQRSGEWTKKGMSAGIQSFAELFQGASPSIAKWKEELDRVEFRRPEVAQLIFEQQPAGQSAVALLGTFVEEVRQAGIKLRNALQCNTTVGIHVPDDHIDKRRSRMVTSYNYAASEELVAEFEKFSDKARDVLLTEANQNPATADESVLSVINVYYTYTRYLDAVKNLHDACYTGGGVVRLVTFVDPATNTAYTEKELMAAPPSEPGFINSILSEMVANKDGTPPGTEYVPALHLDRAPPPPPLALAAGGVRGAPQGDTAFYAEREAPRSRADSGPLWADNQKDWWADWTLSGGIGVRTPIQVTDPDQLRMRQDVEGLPIRGKQSEQEYLESFKSHQRTYETRVAEARYKAHMRRFPTATSNDSAFNETFLAEARVEAGAAGATAASWLSAKRIVMERYGKEGPTPKPWGPDLATTADTRVGAGEALYKETRPTGKIEASYLPGDENHALLFDSSAEVEEVKEMVQRTNEMMEHIMRERRQVGVHWWFTNPICKNNFEQLVDDAGASARTSLSQSAHITGNLVSPASLAEAQQAAEDEEHTKRVGQINVMVTNAASFFVQHFVSAVRSEVLQAHTDSLRERVRTGAASKAENIADEWLVSTVLYERGVGATMTGAKAVRREERRPEASEQQLVVQEALHRRGLNAAASSYKSRARLQTGFTTKAAVPERLRGPLKGHSKLSYGDTPATRAKPQQPVSDKLRKVDMDYEFDMAFSRYWNAPYSRDAHLAYVMAKRQHRMLDLDENGRILSDERVEAVQAWASLATLLISGRGYVDGSVATKADRKSELFSGYRADEDSEAYAAERAIAARIFSYLTDECIAESVVVTERDVADGQPEGPRVDDERERFRAERRDIERARARRTRAVLEEKPPPGSSDSFASGQIRRVQTKDPRAKGKATFMEDISDIDGTEEKAAAERRRRLSLREGTALFRDRRPNKEQVISINFMALLQRSEATRTVLALIVSELYHWYDLLKAQKAVADEAEKEGVDMDRAFERDMQLKDRRIEKLEKDLAEAQDMIDREHRRQGGGGGGGGSRPSVRPSALGSSQWDDDSDSDSDSDSDERGVAPMETEGGQLLPAGVPLLDAAQRNAPRFRQEIVELRRDKQSLTEMRLGGTAPRMARDFVARVLSKRADESTTLTNLFGSMYDLYRHGALTPEDIEVAHMRIERHMPNLPYNTHLIFLDLHRDVKGLQDWRRRLYRNMMDAGKAITRDIDTPIRAYWSAQGRASPDAPRATNPGMANGIDFHLLDCFRSWLSNDGNPEFAGKFGSDFLPPTDMNEQVANGITFGELLERLNTHMKVLADLTDGATHMHRRPLVRAMDKHAFPYYRVWLAKVLERPRANIPQHSLGSGPAAMSVNDMTVRQAPITSTSTEEEGRDYKQVVGDEKLQEMVHEAERRLLSAQTALRNFQQRGAMGMLGNAGLERTRRVEAAAAALEKAQEKLAVFLEAQSRMETAPTVARDMYSQFESEGDFVNEGRLVRQWRLYDAYDRARKGDEGRDWNIADKLGDRDGSKRYNPFYPETERDPPPPDSALADRPDFETDVRDKTQREQEDAFEDKGKTNRASDFVLREDRSTFDRKQYKLASVATQGGGYWTDMDLRYSYGFSYNGIGTPNTAAAAQQQQDLLRPSRINSIENLDLFQRIWGYAVRSFNDVINGSWFADNDRTRRLPLTFDQITATLREQEMTGNFAALYRDENDPLPPEPDFLTERALLAQRAARELQRQQQQPRQRVVQPSSGRRASVARGRAADATMQRLEDLGGAGSLDISRPPAGIHRTPYLLLTDLQRAAMHRQRRKTGQDRVEARDYVQWIPNIDTAADTSEFPGVGVWFNLDKLEDGKWLQVDSAGRVELWVSRVGNARLESSASTVIFANPQSPPENMWMRYAVPLSLSVYVVDGTLGFDTSLQEPGDNPWVVIVENADEETGEIPVESVEQLREAFENEEWYSLQSTTDQRPVGHLVDSVSWDEEDDDDEHEVRAELYERLRAVVNGTLSTLSADIQTVFEDAPLGGLD